MRKIELLSPAKNLECGIEAIKHGADAVYIGGPCFGARAAASNSIEDITSLCQYAHLFGVRVYVTFNTILFDEELKAAEKTIWELYNAGVDALIVQDLSLIKMNLPPIALHASTQLDNRTAQKAQFLENIGFSQIVLARELPIDTIKEISKTVSTPLEVFIHGALCVSYSGACYASQYCFKRSANRGECAQFCRMAFDLINADGKTLVHDRYLLSLKDMNRTDYIEEMMSAGVSSFKIEGRLKDIDYVKNVTAHYRNIIDSIIAKHPETYRRASYGETQINFTPNVYKSFNRGFTNYFIENQRLDNMQNILSPKSMGEKIGIVNKIDRNKKCFIVDRLQNVELTAGDGLCFFDSQNHLCGCRAERVEKSIVYSENVNKLRIGQEIYRNYDNKFCQTLRKQTAKRQLRIRIIFEETNDGFLLSMIDENSHKACVYMSCEHTMAEKPQNENIRKQLSKLGDTPFVVKEINLIFNEDYFIPSSKLAACKRECSQKLQDIILNEYKRDKRLPLRKKKDIANFLPQEMTFNWNVSNKLSAHFYKENGVKNIQPAFEIKIPQEKHIMNCKYCIRYALKACKKSKLTDKELWKEPLALRLANGQEFSVHFDCSKCEMNIYAKNK